MAPPKATEPKQPYSIRFIARSIAFMKRKAKETGTPGGSWRLWLQNHIETMEAQEVANARTNRTSTRKTATRARSKEVNPNFRGKIK